MNDRPDNRPISEAQKRRNALAAIGGDTKANRAYLDSVRIEIMRVGIMEYTDRSLREGTAVRNAYYARKNKRLAKLAVS